MSKALVAAATLAALLSPFVSAALTPFSESVATAKAVVASTPQDQLDGMNPRVFSEAFMAAKIVGFDRSEIDQLKADVAQLKQENAQLRAQLSSAPQPAAQISAPVVNVSLEARVAKLETAFNSLQGTLSLIVSMLTSLVERM